MGNHIRTKPEITARMYLSKDKKYVFSETVITDKRPVSYYLKQLLPGMTKKKA